MAGIREQVVQDPGSPAADVRRLHTLSREAVLYDEVRTVYRTVTTGSYDIDEDDHLILADTSGGVITLALPLAADVPGREYIIKRTTTDTNTVSVTLASGNIDGAASPYVITGGARDSRTFKSDGTDWWVV